MKLVWSGSPVETVNADFSKYDKFIAFVELNESFAAYEPLLIFSKNQKYGNGGYYGNSFYVATITDNQATTQQNSNCKGFVQIWGLD